MIKKFAVYIIGLVLSVSITGCNEDSSPDAEITYRSTLVKSFSLKENDKILNNLDSVYFSIDLVNGRIFNADSLPFGTDVSKLVVSLTTDACSVIELNVPRKNDTDTVINYRTSSTDSINFANGPVKLHLVSYDGQAKRDYDIRVNVHQVEPDSLYWNRLAVRPLPSSTDSPYGQKTVKAGDKAVCMTLDLTKGYCVAVSDDPSSDDWEIYMSDIDGNPDLGSLAAVGDKLYIPVDGVLYSSDDYGRTWNSTGVGISAIYGAYQDRILGLKFVPEDGRYYHVTYPGGELTDMPDDFPVAGVRSMVYVSSEWADAPQALIAGGVTKNGKYSSSVWGYDGSRWAKITDRFPLKAKGVTMFNYRVTETDTVRWTLREYPALIAMGGKREDGVNGNVYISKDYGLNWKKGDDLLQLPKYVPPMYDADALIFDTTFSGNSRSGSWTYYEPKVLPVWCRVSQVKAPGRSVVSADQWQCPYIYLFGGVDDSERYCNTIWKGVINRLTFKPLQ